MNGTGAAHVTSADRASRSEPWRPRMVQRAMAPSDGCDSHPPITGWLPQPSGAGRGAAGAAARGQRGTGAAGRGGAGARGRGARERGATSGRTAWATRAGATRAGDKAEGAAGRAADLLECCEWAGRDSPKVSTLTGPEAVG